MPVEIARTITFTVVSWNSSKVVEDFVLPVVMAVVVPLAMLVVVDQSWL